jgi:serine/threonine protein kinase
VSIITHKESGRKLVWKQIAYLKKDADKIMQEVLIGRSVTSEYLVEILDTFVEEGFLYIVMEYYSEGTLQKLIEEVSKSKKGISESVSFLFIFNCFYFYLFN